MTTRYKQDAAYELVGVEARIRSTEKSERNTANRKTADIATAVLASLRRQADKLRQEVAALPERPVYMFGKPVVDGPPTECWPNGLAKATYPDGVYREPEDIPDFLKRV